MAKRVSKLTLRYRRKLKPGEQVQENGIRYRARENGDGTWFIRYHDAANRPVQETVGRVGEGATLDRAKELLLDRQAAVQNEDFIYTPKRAKEKLPTVAAFFERDYMPWSKAHKRTWADDQSRFRLYLAETFGDHRLD